MSVNLKKTEDVCFSLRLAAGPYVPFFALIILLLLITLPYIFKTRDMGPLLGVAIVTFFSADLIYSYTRYRIWWQGNKLYQKAVNRDITVLEVEDIRNIRQESSDLHTLLSLRRPSRRITLHGETSEGQKVIDISLVHFKKEDIKKLMRMIHEKRPDLEMPKGWV